MPGVADGSFGVEVAKLAQLPVPVIDTCATIIAALERQPENIVYEPARKITIPGASLKNKIIA